MQSKSPGSVERHEVGVDPDPSLFSDLVLQVKSQFSVREGMNRAVNKILTYCLFGGLFAIAVLGYCLLAALHEIHEKKPYFIAQLTDGSFRTIDPETLTLRVSDAMLHGTIDHFVTGFTGRESVQSKQSYDLVSEAFLDQSIKDGMVANDIENVKAVARGQADEVQVEVVGRSVRNTRWNCADDQVQSHQCTATWSTIKSYYDAMSHQLRKQARATVDFSFVRKDSVNQKQLKGMNLLGIVVTEFREHVENAPLSSVENTSLSQ